MSQAVFAYFHIGDPQGISVNGIFDTKFTVTLSYQCVGNSKRVTSDYASTRIGKHTYAFYSENITGNPYVRVDGSNYAAVDSSCKNNKGISEGTLGYSYKGSLTEEIDAKSPLVSITSPSVLETIQTTESSYTITISAGDPEGNLTSLKAIRNGATVASQSATSNGSYNIEVPLEYGLNSIQIVPYDIVNHTTTSSTVTINLVNPVNDTTGDTSSGGGTTSGNTSSSSSSSSNTKNSTSNTKKSEVAPAPAVKFGKYATIDITDPYGGSLLNSDVVQETTSLRGATGTTYGLLVAAIAILFGVSIFVVYRLRQSGLRKRIIIVVTIPSIIPMLGLGFVGYQQLSGIVKNTLSGQLQTASQTSALKLQREFSIRNTIITQNANVIFQVKNQYESHAKQLSKQEKSCEKIVNVNVPIKSYDKITSSENCLPFLAGFAQLLRYSSATLTDYLDSLHKGAKNAKSNIIAQQTQRENELLNSLRNYFPDLLELDIVDATKKANVVTLLPRTNPNQPTTIEAHHDLVLSASTKSLSALEKVGSTRQLLLTYPVVNDDTNKTTLGGVIAAFDVNGSFVTSILNSTPKSYDSDRVYILTTAGDIIAPYSSKNQELTKDQVIKLAAVPPGTVYDLQLSNKTLTTRTATVPNTNWVVAVGAPPNAVLAPFSGIQQTALLAIAGFLLLSLLLGVWFVGGIAGEIDMLFQGALQFAKGKLDHRITLKSKDELQALGDTMNQMANDIKEAQTALIQKDKDFINVATHELRAPITSAIGNLSMVIDDNMGKIDETAHSLINQAYLSSQRLRDIVNDMLDIARLESGRSEYQLVEIDIKSLIQSIVEMQSIPAKQATITLQYEAKATTPNVFADKNKLQIIITNFISNAIKYNKPNGTITLSHKVDGAMLVTSIADTGLGIPDDQKAHMFEKFYRVQDKDRTNVPGTGLGLHITKQFIEAMGGKVWFESTHGKGTTFYFSIPKASPAQLDKLEH